MTLAETFFSRMLRRRAWILAAVLGLSAVAIYLQGDRKVVSSLRELFEMQNAVTIAGRALMRTFGEGVHRPVIIAFESPSVFSNETLATIGRLTESLEQSPYVAKVYSLTTMPEVLVVDDMLSTEPIVDPSRTYTAGELSAIERRALAHPAMVDALTSRDGTVAGVIVRDNFTLVEFPRKNKPYVESLQAIVDAESARSGFTFHMAGVPVMERAAMRAQKDDEYLLLYAAILLPIVLFLFFRSFADTIIPLAVAGLTVVWLDGTKVLVGHEFNMLAVLVTILMVVTSLSDSILFVSERRAMLAERGSLDMGRLTHLVFRPSLLTSATTAVGVGTMIFSGIRVLQEFGVAGAIGLGIEWVLFVVMLPILYSRSEVGARAHPQRPTRIENHILTWVARTTTAHSGRVVAGGFLFVLVMCAGMLHLDTESDPYSYLSRAHATVNAVDFLDERLRGVVDIGIMVEAEAKDAFTSPEALRRVERFQAKIEAEPGVSKTFSAVDLIKQLNSAMHEGGEEHFVLPDSKALVAQYLLLFSMAGQEEELLRLLDFDYRRLRVNVNRKNTREAELRAFVQRLQAYADSEIGPDFTVSVSGVPLEILAINDYLVRAQVISVALGLTLVTALIALGFRSVRLGLLSVVPTVIPVIGIFGIMGWTGIALSVGTVMIAPVAIGVGIDYAVHFFSRYGHARRAGLDDEAAVRSVLESKGRAALLTTIVLCVGFGVQVFSAFKPIEYFGWIATAAILIAFGANFIILPAIIMMLGTAMPGSTVPAATRSGQNGQHSQTEPSGPAYQEHG